MAKRTFSRQTQASAASRSSASLASASSDLPPPPPSPGRLAKVLSRTPHALTPSHRSSSQSSSTMGAVMSSSSSSSTSTAQVPPSPSTGGRFRRVFAARRKKTDDGQTQLVLHPPRPPPPTTTGSQGPIPARSNQSTSSSHPPTTLAGEPSPTLGLAAPAPPPKSPRMMPPPSQHPPAITAPPRTSSVPAAILPTATAPAHETPTVTTTTAPAPVPAPVPAPPLVQAPSSNAAPAPDPAISLSTVHERTPVIDGSTGASSQPKEPESAVEQVTDAEPHEGEGEGEHATAMMAAESHDGNHPTATTATTQAGTDHMPRDPEPERRARDPGPDHKAKEPEPDHRSREAEVDHKADWRKSDATMSSYYTVRPPSSGARTRPVSMADSLQSTSTVVANTTKRLSALLTEAEFVMAEADEDPVPSSSSASASASLHRRASSARKRHSISLHFTAATTPTAPSTSGSTPTPTVPPSSVTRAAAAGIISPTTRNGIPSSPASQIRGRLAAWAPSPESPNTPPFPPGPDKWMPQVPAQHMQQHDQQQQQAQAHARQGMLGFGKRAVERMGRALGGLSSNNHAHAHTNSTSHTGSTSSSSSAGSGGVPDEWRRPRRTPNAPSGTWSISTTGTGAASASSASDVDGPGLGERMRPPMATRGLVFAQPLERCVRHTALEPVRVRLEAEAESGGQLDAGVRVPLEERLVPALVVRCAQHIMKWGLEEEGLFRISGRASHVAKLRAEFDTGADYDLRECPPGDLDPHAVASIFKAYLRELPEPILTKRLNPLFEAAMAHENETRQSLDNAAGANSGPNTPSPSNSPKLGGPGQRRSALPTSPRDARLLKPPSLSTLAMPNFAGMRPPSDRLLATFANLVARLPREHRDLLRTVTELIRATAARRETRMPLSNLTVVFCPSLAMSPPILRVLCESEEIWDGPRSPVSVGAPAEVTVGDANDTKEPGDVVASVPAADDTASSVSSDAPREPWPPLSSPSSSSLATPNNDSASSVLAPQAADTDDEFGIRSADGAAVFKTSSTPPVAFPSSSISPGPSSRCLDSLSSSVSSLSSTSPSTSSPRRMLSISGPLHLPPRAATTPSTPVTGSPTILPAFAPIERQKRPSLTARFAKRSLNSLRASRAFSNSRSGSSSPVISAPFIVGREPESEPEPELETEAEVEVEVKPKQKPMGRPPMLEMPPEMSPLKVPDVLREDDGDLAKEKRREKGVSRMRHASASSPNLTTPALPITASNEREKQSGEKGEGEVESKPSSHTRGMTPLTNLPEPYNRLSLWEDSGDDVVDGEWASSVLLAADAGWLGNGTESER